jgi:hypothetical protein
MPKGTLVGDLHTHKRIRVRVPAILRMSLSGMSFQNGHSNSALIVRKVISRSPDFEEAQSM